MVEYLNFIDEFDVKVENNSPSTNSLVNHYKNITSEPPNTAPDLTITPINHKPESDWYIKGRQFRYERTKEGLLISAPSGEFLIIDRKFNHFMLSSNHLLGSAKYFIEYEVRKKLANKDIALLHASGIQKNGITYLFHGPGSTGKTKTMITMIQDGGKYLGDDRIWVDADGTIYGFDLPTKVGQSMSNSFTDILDGVKNNDYKLALSTYLYDKCSKDENILQKIGYFVNKYYIEPRAPDKYVSVSDFSYNPEFCSKSSIDQLIMLRSNPNIERVTEQRKLSTEEAVNEMRSIAMTEWNQFLQEAFLIHDLMYDGSKVDEFEKVIEKESEVFKNLADCAKLSSMSLPRKKHWGTNIQKDIRTELKLNKP